MYRETTLGNALKDSISDLVNSGELTEEHQETIMLQFDDSVLDVFAKMPKPSRHTKIQGTSVIYNNVDEIWKFVLSNMDIKDENFGFQEGSDRCLIVTQNGKNNFKEPPPESDAPKNKKNKKFGRQGR